MPRLGLAGWPVAHSRSPAMFAAAFAALGMEGWRYGRLPIPPELFDETLPALGPVGFHGVNVTIPHKERALALAEHPSAEARAIGAANTLVFEPGGMRAENTDAPGFLRALGRDPAGMRALVLGAGGSARAVVWALCTAGADVHIFNRTVKRAGLLADEIGASVAPGPVPADLLVNCTSLGLGHLATEGMDLTAMGISAATVAGYPLVVDMVYAEGDTPLIRTAREHGSHAVGGLEVLVEQGALSFELWTGRPAPRQAMRAAVRDADAR